MASVLFFIAFAAFTAGYFLLLNGMTLSVLTILWLVVALALAFASSFVLLGISMALVGRFRKNPSYKDKVIHGYIISVMRLLTRLMRLKIHASGLENIPEYPVILVGNHQAMYETLVIKPLIPKQPVIYIAKESLFKLPIANRVIRQSGNIPIGRLADRSAVKAILKGVERYNDGHSVVIFPEGRRSHTNAMIDFKPGAFKLAMRPKAPILPFTIYNFVQLWRGWPFKRHHVYIHFHPPLTYDAYKEMTTQALSNYIKGIIQSQLDVFEKSTP